MNALATAFTGLFCGTLLALGISWCAMLEADRRAGFQQQSMTPGKAAKHYTARLGQ